MPVHWLIRVFLSCFVVTKIVWDSKVSGFCCFVNTSILYTSRQVCFHVLVDRLEDVQTQFKRKIGESLERLFVAWDRRENLRVRVVIGIILLSKVGISLPHVVWVHATESIYVLALLRRGTLGSHKLNQFGMHLVSDWFDLVYLWENNHFLGKQTVYYLCIAFLGPYERGRYLF